MASSTESDCHKDPNFAVICSFLDKYGESLGLPQVSYSDLERYLQDNTNNVSRVLIDIHVRLLRRIGKSSVTSDRFEKSIIKFCHHFSEFDAWEVESYGYKHANVKTKLRILKNLLECQFDYNIKFKEKVNESSAEDMRFLPIGRDKEGQAYWYFLDNDLNLLIYKEEQDDEDADTWQLVCSDRQQLAKLVDSLKVDALKEVKEEDDKTSTESRSSKEGSPDKEMSSKEGNENVKSEDTQKTLKQEPDLVVKEEPVERDKKEGSSAESVVKMNATESDGKDRKKSDRKGSGKSGREKEIKLVGKVELNVSIKRLSEESVEKYKKRKEGENCAAEVKTEPAPSISLDQEPESSRSGHMEEAKDKEQTNRSKVKETNVPSGSEGKQLTSEKPADNDERISNVETESGKGSAEKVRLPSVPQKDTEISQSGETKSSKEQNNATADVSIAHKDKEGVGSKSSSGEHKIENFSKEKQGIVSEKGHEETLPEEREENTETDKSKLEEIKSSRPNENVSEVEPEKSGNVSKNKDKASCSSSDGTQGKSDPSLSGEIKEDDSSAKANEKAVTPDGGKVTSFDSKEAQERSEPVENDNVCRPEAASEKSREKLNENVDEAAKNIPDAQAGNTPKDISADKNVGESQTTPQDKETTAVSCDSIHCPEKIEDSKAENLTEKTVESVSVVEKCGEKEEKGQVAAKGESSPETDKNLKDNEKINDENPEQSDLPKDPDKNKTVSVEMSKVESVEIRSAPDISDAEEEDFIEMGDDNEIDEFPVIREDASGKDEEDKEEKATLASGEPNAVGQKLGQSDTESTEKSVPQLQKTDDSEEKGHEEVSDQITQSAGKSEKDVVENSENAQTKSEEVSSSTLLTAVVEESKESVIVAEKADSKIEEKKGNVTSQTVLQVNSSNAADVNASEEKDTNMIASDKKDDAIREKKKSSTEKPSTESDDSKSPSLNEKEDSENKKDDATKLKPNDHGNEPQPEEKNSEVQSSNDASQPSKTSVDSPGETKAVSSGTQSIEKSSGSLLTSVVEAPEERSALTNGPKEEDKEKGVSAEITEEKPSQSNVKNEKEVKNRITEKITGNGTSSASGSIASEALKSSAEKVEDQCSGKSEKEKVGQKDMAEKTPGGSGRQKEDGLQSDNGIKESEEVKESKSSDGPSDTMERDRKEEKKSKGESVKSDCVDKGQEAGEDKSKKGAGQSESTVERGERGEEEKSREDKAESDNVEKEGEKKAEAENAQTCAAEKRENEEDKQSKAKIADNVEKDEEEKQPNERAEQTQEAKKEASNKSEQKDNEKKDQEQSQTAGGEEESKEVKDNPKTDETDGKSGEAIQSQKKTRGSATPRNLKRAAPEPASDEIVESEPNGKRARPTTRVVKTRGGRNAAARGRASRLANKESESEDSESVAPAKSKRGVGRGRGRGGRGRGTSRNSSATKKETDAKIGREENDEDGSDQASGKRAKKKKPDSSSEALSEEEVTPAKKGRNQIQSKKSTRGAPASRGNRRGGRGGGKGVAAKKAAQPAMPVQQEEEGSRRRSARVKEMKARRPPTPSSPEESEPTEEEDEDEEDFEPEKFILEGSFTPEEESGDEEFKPKGRNFQRQAARIQEKNEAVINDDTPCVKCGKYNHPEMILLCDKCDAGYHTACLRPPLMVIPDGDWFCPPCEHSMLVERLFACLQSLDIALKKKDRLSKRQERLAYVGISINNILHGDRPVLVSDKFDGKQGSVKEEEEGDEEEEEEDPSEASSSYESEEEVPERKFRSERLATRQAEKRSRREKHKRRKTSRAQSPDSEVFAKRTCRTRNAVSYQFKEFDELISNAIDDDQPVRKEKPPGRSRGKDMSNILGASDEEDEKIRKRDQEEGAPEPPIPVVRKKPKRRLTGLDSDEDEEVDDDSEEFKLSENDDSDATEVEDADDGEGDDDELTEENSDSGDWKPKKTWYNSRNNRSNRRRKFVVEEDDYDSDENASKRRSTRNSTRGRVTYDDWDSEEETEVETEEEEETSFSDFSSDDSRFARKMKKEKEKRLQKAAGKDSKSKSKRKGDGDEEESEGSVSDSSMVRKRKMLMKLVKKRRKDESGNEDTEEAEVSKSKIRPRKGKRKTFSEDSSASFDEEEEEESGSDESDQPRSKKKNVLRSSDEDETEMPTNGETATTDEKTEVIENNKAIEVETSEAKVTEEPQPKGPGKRGSPSKAQTPIKGKKRGEGINLKTVGSAEVKDEPVPGKVRRLSGSDKEGATEPNLPLETPTLQKKAQPARRGRAASKEGQGEASPEKKSPAVGNRRSSTDKQTRSGKKKRLPNFLNVPSGGESDEEEGKASAASETSSKPDQPVSSAQAIPPGVQQPATGPSFPPQQNQGPQPRGYQLNQRLAGPQAQQFNPAFPTGQMGPVHLRPGLSSPPHSMATTGHDDSSSAAQVPPHYSAPPGHPGSTGLAAANMRGPYPKYNGVPTSQMPQGMPPHMMNQALEPGQIPPLNMNQPPHVRHPSQPMPQPPPHSMGHDQPHPGTMQQQQWADHRAPGQQPPSYGNAHRMSYPREMVPRQPYYHMRSPPPHNMGQYPPHMGSPVNNPLTSMGQMTRNLSPGMKSPPPRSTGEAGGEDGKTSASQDTHIKQEVSQEALEKGRDADTASPEKGAGKIGGKRAKASSPKSHSEKPEGEESSANKAQTQPDANPPSQSQPSQPAQPASSSAMPYQQHPYMNSQQGFYMPQHYRMPYGGPNQGPMNQMQGVPPYHNQYMNPNQPFPHRPYIPQQMTNMPPNPMSGQNPPPSSMPSQQSQSNIGPSQSMPSSMSANPNIPFNQQRLPPPMNANQQAQHGTPDATMMPPASYQQRPPGMAPNQVSGPGFMPGYNVPSSMPHPSMPQGAHGMQPAQQMGPQGAPQNQTGLQQGVQSAPANHPNPLRMPQAQLPQGSVGMAPNQQPPVSMPSHPQGNMSSAPASSQGELTGGQGPHAPGPQMVPYYQVPPGQQPQAGAPTLPPPPPSESGAQQKAESEVGKTQTEPKRSGSPSDNQKVSETDGPQEHKTASEAHMKEEPKAAPQEAQLPQAYPQGETKPPQGGGANTPNTAGSNMPTSRSNDPIAMPNANSRNFPPTTMGQGHPHQSGQVPPMPYYNPGPYYQPYRGNMPPQGEHMHSQVRWGPNMPPYGPRFGGHPYPPYGMGPEAMNMMPGQGMHGNTGVPHPQSTPSGGPSGMPPHTAVPSTPPHPGLPQDFQAPRDQAGAVRNRRSSSTDSRSNLPPAAEALPETPVSSSSQPQLSPPVSSPSTSVKSEQLPTVSSPSLPLSSSSSSSSTSTTTTASTPPVSHQAPVSSSSPKSIPVKSENKDCPPERGVPPMSMGPQSTWSGPNMNHQYSHAMGQMHRMGAPGPYNVMPPYGPQGMMPPQPHNFYMMGPNPRQANSKGPGQANFHQYQGHMPPQAHGMNPMLGMNQPPMSYNGGYRPPYMAQGQEHSAMPPRPDFKSEMQSGPNPSAEMGSPVQNPAPDSQTNEGNAVAPKAKKAKTQKKKEPGAPNSSRGKGTKGRGRGRGGFMIDSLLQARGAGTGEEEAEETGEMKDIVNYVTTDEYIKRQTSS